jgi:hypothetical protein
VSWSGFWDLSGGREWRTDRANAVVFFGGEGIIGSMRLFFDVEAVCKTKERCTPSEGGLYISLEQALSHDSSRKIARHLYLC